MHLIMVYMTPTDLPALDIYGLVRRNVADCLPTCAYVI